MMFFLILLQEFKLVLSYVISRGEENEKNNIYNFGFINSDKN